MIRSCTVLILLILSTICFTYPQYGPPPEEVPAKPESVDVPAKPESVDVSAQTGSVDVPIKQESVDVPLQPESVDVPAKPESVDVPIQTGSVDDSIKPESVDVHEKPESVDVPTQTGSVDVPIKPESVDVPLEPESVHVLVEPENIHVTVVHEIADVPIVQENVDVSVQQENIEVPVLEESADISKIHENLDVSIPKENVDGSVLKEDVDVLVQQEQVDVPFEDGALTKVDAEHKEELKDYWWKIAEIFKDKDSGKVTEIKEGEGVGGPFTPHQSSFCETGFDCVPWEICIEGFISITGGSAIQSRTKPANYETLKCGQAGNICCGIPPQILEEQQKNVENIDSVDKQKTTDEIHKEKGTDTETNLSYGSPSPTPVVHGHCDDESYKCVPHIQCKDGVINTDGSGIINKRILPKKCQNPDQPDIPAICCLHPGEVPTGGPLKKCASGQECVESKLCSPDGKIITDGAGSLDLRIGHAKKCLLSPGINGVCCNIPIPHIASCPDSSVCTHKSDCLGQALDNTNNFIDFATEGQWTQCTFGSEDRNGICCIPLTDEIVKACPDNSLCTSHDKCVNNQALDASGTFSVYDSTKSWTTCSLDNKQGICCIVDEPVIIDLCPENSVCVLNDQCSGQALDITNKFFDYIPTGSWSICSLGENNGICCSPKPVILETCPQNSICVLGNSCLGKALDNSNNFIPYVSSGHWSTCLVGSENGVCCAQSEIPPEKIIDVCPEESICLLPNECKGKAMDGSNSFLDYLPEKEWAHCSSSDQRICCINPKSESLLTPAQGCGIRNYNIDSRITSKLEVNEASFGEFPWQSIVFYKNYTFKCGASLVSNKHIITAAHCADKIEPSDILVRFGEWQVNKFDEELPYVDRNVVLIHIHAKFNPTNVHNDIALMVLEFPLEFQYHINTICLPQKGQIIEPYTPCVATGWGKDSFKGSFQHILKKIDLPFINHETCQTLLRKTRLGKYFRLDSSFVCAGGEENKDACFGDGGGPLISKDKATGQYALVGITSWGIGCGKKDVPGVYVNVELFVDWILNIIHDLKGTHIHEHQQIKEEIQESHQPQPDQSVPQELMHQSPQPHHPQPDDSVPKEHLPTSQQPPQSQPDQLLPHEHPHPSQQPEHPDQHQQPQPPKQPQPTQPEQPEDAPIPGYGK